MKYCTNCGAQIDDNASFCSSCGYAVQHVNEQSNNFNQQTYNQTNQGYNNNTQNYQSYDYSNTNKPAANDAPNTGYAVLGFFIPLAGLIIYLATKDSTPLKAKSAGKGALIGFIVRIGVSILWSILSFALTGMVVSSYSGVI